MTEFVKIIHSNLKTKKTEMGDVNWYGDDVLLEKINENIYFDLVIVDGPPANYPNIQYSRLPAIDFVTNRLNDDFCLIIDDANRKGEKKIIELYLKKSQSLKYSNVGNTMAVFRSKNGFNPIPIYYVN